MFDRRQYAAPAHDYDHEDEFEVGDLDVRDVLAVAVDVRRTADRAEADLLALAAHWADLHAALPGQPRARLVVDGMEELVPLAGEGAPEVSEFAPAELGAALGLTTYAAQRLVGDALELRHRLPRVWARVQDQSAARPLAAWRARRIAQATLLFPPAAAGEVDARLAPVAHKVGLQRITTLVEAALVSADPDLAARRAEAVAERRGVWLDRSPREGHLGVRVEADLLDAQAFDAALDAVADALAVRGDIDLAQVRRAKALGYLADPEAAMALLTGSPTSVRPHREVVLYVHLSQDALRGPHATGRVARVEDAGPVSVEQVARWVARSAETTTGAPLRVRVTPVRDLAETTSVDAYEAPTSLRETVLLRSPCCPFPWCENLSRGKDLDHVQPYRPLSSGGPPGQTGPHNLSPLCRRHHRLKTHAGWSYTMPEPGLHLWRSPTGRGYLVDQSGTSPLADTG